MIPARRETPVRRSLPRGNRLRCAIVALAAAALLTGTACDEEAAARAFRDAAAGSLQTGVSSILNGVVDGLFAALEVGDDQPSDSSSSATTSS